MAKRAVSLNLTIETTSEQMKDEKALREICVKRMGELLNMKYYVANEDMFVEDACNAFEESVTIESFDDDDEAEN